MSKCSIVNDDGAYVSSFLLMSDNKNISLDNNGVFLSNYFSTEYYNTITTIAQKTAAETTAA